MLEGIIARRGSRAPALTALIVRRRVLAAGVVVIAFVALQAAPALARSRASCRVQIHIRLSAALGAAINCELGVGRMSLLAAVPVLLSNRRFVHLAGTIGLGRLAGTLLLSGSGRAGQVSAVSPGSERVTYTGIGAFRPDRGENCTSTPVTSGTLTEQLIITSRTR